jgi:L-fuculose-phosphate aldolase
MDNYINEKEAREIICEIGRRVYDREFVAGNDGNISARIGPNEIVATPTGVSKGFMTPAMLVKLDLDGKVLSDGGIPPSSEVKMHLRVFRECPDVGGVVHTHPPIATAYASAGLPLEEAILPEGVIFLGNVPCADFALPGTEEVPDSVAPFCEGYNAVLLGNHGALTWGANLMEAFFRAETLEHYAKIHMYTRYILKSDKTISPQDVQRLLELRAHYGHKRGGTPVAH